MQGVSDRGSGQIIDDDPCGAEQILAPPPAALHDFQDDVIGLRWIAARADRFLPARIKGRA
jgi:hypothetical protein